MMMRLVLVTKVLFVALFRIWVISLVNYMNQIAERLRYDRSLDSHHNAGEVKQHTAFQCLVSYDIVFFKGILLLQLLHMELPVLIVILLFRLIANFATLPIISYLSLNPLRLEYLNLSTNPDPVLPPTVFAPTTLF